MLTVPDDYNTFRRVYEAPILKSRAPSSTAKEQELGETRSAQVLFVAGALFDAVSDNGN